MGFVLLWLAFKFLRLLALGIDKTDNLGYKGFDGYEDLFINGVYTPGEEFLI